MFNKDKKPVYFITGGGTGGHIYPSVAVINELINSGVEKENIFYLGNEDNLEYEVANKNSFNFLSYRVKGMPRKISFAFIKWLIELFFATLQALIYVIQHKPSVVFATGGYVCAPILFCAFFLRIPYVLHESDIQPGIVTRLFAPSASSVSVAFEDAAKFIKSKNINLNGNPIRQEFSSISKRNARKELSLKDDFTILIMGGSLGAKTINDAAFRILKEYANQEDVTIIWQTGKKNFDDVVTKILIEFEELPHNLVLQAYYDKMYLALLSADLVISRAGSLSLSEICACNLPSILVPYPYASQDHQKKNAEFMVKSGAALMLEDKDCSDENLSLLVYKLMNNKEILSNLAYNAKKLAKTDSSQKIVEQIKSLIK